MNKLKVVHVTQSLGGVKTYIEHLFNYSSGNEFDYVIIAPEHSEFQEFCSARNITYHPVKIKRSINPVQEIAVLFNIISILKKEKPDIVHTHSAKGGYLGRIAAKFVSAKVIYSPHAFSFLSFKGIKRIAFYFLEFIARKWTDILLSVSYSEANRAIHEVGYEKNKVRVILNAIPVEDTLPFRNYSKCYEIGMIGRLTYQKNPFLFLELASKILEKFPNIKFSILGAGLCDHLSEDINAYLVENNLVDKIEILKWGDNNKSKNYLKSIDIFLMTSVFEGLPFSLVEAMASGLPCIVSKVDGNTDVIQNLENGFACLSIDEFYRKIETLVQSEELRRKFGQAGYRYVKEVHDVKKNVKLLEDLYLSLTKRKGPVKIKIVEENVDTKQLINLQVNSNF